jgi:UDP:flavonoid glycosyltransferase YjiC (YdhE family)
MVAGASPPVVTGQRRLRVAVLTVGSRGDVEPYLGLGVALVTAGHRVTVAASAAFEGLVRRAGLDPFLVEPDPRLVSVRGEPARWLPASASAGAIRLHLASRAGSSLGAAYSGYLEASRDADVVLYPAWLAPVARTIAETRSCLALPAYLAPIHPTRAFPSPFLPIPSHTGWNRLSHWAAVGLWRTALDGAPNAWRSRSLGLPPAPIELLPPAGEACLYGFCRSLLSAPPDWPPGAVVTGPWWLDAPDRWRPPEDLDRFLRAPGKVVFLGFGSMLDAHPSRLNSVVEAALTRLGCRAVLLAGPAGQLDLSSSPHRITVQDIPLEWLFRRVDAIVHHGGAGTAAQAARAGKPSVVVPFFGDQFFWGQRIHLAGGGPRPIPRRALTSERLASAIQETLDDPRSAEQAARLGAQVRAETGLSTAVRLIEAACPG